MADTNEGVPYVEIIKSFKQKLHDAPTPFLDSDNKEVWPDEKSSLKNRKIVPLTDNSPLITVFGPKIDKGPIPEQTQIFGERVCARTISTYPQQTLGNTGQRDGDPVCDRYGFYLFTNRSIVVVADGCNWGERPRRAAERARNSVMGYLKEKNSKIKTVSDAELYLLRSFNEAHNRICEKLNPDEEIGSTTLLAGIALEIEGENGAPNEWAFVCTSVGDCKAFLIRESSRCIVDITMNNRVETKNATDCGGRLGPVMPDGGPDLRNLVTFCCRVLPGDMIMVMSDGVHDNLHPGSLNILPKDLKLNYETWDDASKDMSVEEVASRFRVRYLGELLGDVKYTPLNVLECAVTHSEKTTEASRDFMENQPGKRLPKDYSLYPGKMDHTTCVTFTVGPADFQHPISPQLTASSEEYIAQCVPISVTLSKDTKNFTIYCRTVAKGKFECLAKKHECILTVSPRRPFVPAESEKVWGSDELSARVSRVVKIPEEVDIDVSSKQISYDADVGIITIRFALSDVN